MTLATKFWTLAQIKEKIQLDTATEGDVFIEADELTGYINEAIDDAEAIIHKMHEDYFLKKGTISLVQGTEEYSMPSDIYAHKIRSIIYANGSDVYEVVRIRDWKKFIYYHAENINQSANRYVYFVVNSAVGTPKILISPSAKVTASDVLHVWYYRQANTLVSSSDACDLPEFINYIFAHVKVNIYLKDGGYALAKFEQDKAFQREQMMEVLRVMCPDNNDEIEPDLTHYEEMA